MFLHNSVYFRKTSACSTKLFFSFRSFSIMNHIRTKSRNRLGGLATDILMRLRLNGPKALIDFPAEIHAEIWLKNRVSVDDPIDYAYAKRRRERLKNNGGGGGPVGHDDGAVADEVVVDAEEEEDSNVNLMIGNAIMFRRNRP